ncbi:Tumor necrosis factor-inducible gene 6 protein [Liparis tanakae]|uniref:Tumor necrosis factor-inducible gene 6 protein n=1 Tax=Liparis tanakae TaxID=230148 RepID=A0A4Z2DZ68_9TELE|nr:Tumor necrosis factor-inducible gene 6 protein [Liparis tanakae]
MLLLRVLLLWSRQLGMHLCVAGWMEGGKVGCGDNHVGLVLYKEPVDQSSKYDAYCYRLRGTEAAPRQPFVLLVCCCLFCWSLTASQRLTEPHRANRASQSLTEPHRASQSLTELHRASQSLTELTEPHSLTASQSLTELHRASQSLTEPHRASQRVLPL